MFSKRSQEGYLLIDQRATGMPVGRSNMLECATITCSHCQQVLIVNPLRTRERGYCPGCDHYVCDGCNAIRVQTGVCKTFKQVMDEVEQAALKKSLNRS